MVLMRRIRPIDYLCPLEEGRYGPLRLRKMARHHNKVLEMEKVPYTSMREGSRQIYSEMTLIKGVCLNFYPDWQITELRND